MAQTTVDGSFITDNTIDGTKIAVGSDARGDVLIYDGTNYVRLGADNGKFLRSNGTGSNPSWETVSSGGASLNGSTANGILSYGSSSVADVESTLTYTGGQLTINNDGGAAIFHVDGSNGQALIKYKNAGTAKWDVGIDPDGSGNQKSHVDDWCMYNGGTYGVVISGNGSNQFGIGTQAGIALSGAEIPDDGIQFPATQNTNSSANNLDDYEEGIFSPTMMFGGANTSIAYTEQSGTYTKIGDRVIYSIRLRVSNKGSSTGSLQVGGLPFAVGTGTRNYSAHTMYWDKIASTGTLIGYNVTGGSYLDIRTVNDSGTNADITDSGVTNGLTFHIAGTYSVRNIA